jgi:tetratricopeptide (TPR) repeat protein
MTEATKGLLKQAEQAMRESRLADAKRDVIEAINLLRQDGTRADLARVVRGLGELERKLGDGEAALRHYEEAVAFYRGLDEPLRFAHTVRHLGDVHHKAGRAHLAEPCYEEALALYRIHPAPPPGDLANAIRSMAVLKDEADDIEQAILLWSEARDLYSKLPYPPAVAETSARLALLAHRKGDFKQAREWLNEAKAAAEAVDDPDTLRYTRKAEARIETQ